MCSFSAVYPFASRKSKITLPAEVISLLNCFPEAALLVDRSNGTILAANAAALLLQPSQGDLTGLELASLLTPMDGARSLAEFLQHPEVKPAELYELILADDEKLPVEITAKPLQPNQKRGGWLFLEMTPVEQRQQRQTEKLRLEQMWRALISLTSLAQREPLTAVLAEALNISMGFLGGEVSLLYQVQGEKLILERIGAAGKSEHFPETIFPSDLMILKKPQLWQSKERTATTLQRAARAAGLHYLASAPLGQVNASIGIAAVGGKEPLPNNALEIVQFLAAFLTMVLQNESTTRALERKLTEQEYTLAISDALKDQIKDCLLVLSPDLRVLDLNRSAEQSLGYSLQEIFQRPVEEILISERSLLPELEAVRHGTTYHQIENIRIFRRNGASFPANVRIFPINGAGLSGLIILFQDTSEQESFRIRSEQLEQRALLGEVTASFAHEVRNPINNISTGLQLLSMNLPADDPNYENVLRLQHECNRLNDLIKSGLSFIKPIEYKMDAIDIAQVMRNFLERWQGRLRQHQIDCQVQIEAQLPFVEGDARALEQVLSNLMNNAIQALVENCAPDNRIIGVKVQLTQELAERSQVEISISDNGPGIPEENRDRIFEPFFTTRKGGTGIGLAIVKRIITAHKGSVSVESFPGATVFRIVLPVYRKKTSPLGSEQREK